MVLTKKNEVSSLIKLLKEREIDIVIESTLPTVLLKRSASAYPILTVWRKGRESYRSLLFVRKDSGIGRASDLKGKIIAFEDPGSTSAYFLPKIILRSKGLNLVKVGSFNSPVPKGTVGYTFAGSEINISSWVFHKKVAAGAVSNIDWSTKDKIPEPYKKEVKIILKSEPIPRTLVSVREGLDKALVERIKEELLSMDKSEEGREALKPYHANKFAEPSSWEFLSKFEQMLVASGEKID